MRALERAAPVCDAGRDLQAARMPVAHQELHQPTLGRRAVAGVVESDLQRADRVPPIGLRAVDVPRLCGAGVHERVAPLAEAVEEAVGLADDLSEESSLVLVSDELLQDDALYLAHHSALAPCART